MTLGIIVKGRAFSNSYSLETKLGEGEKVRLCETMIKVFFSVGTDIDLHDSTKREIKKTNIECRNGGSLQ